MPTAFCGLVYFLTLFRHALAASYALPPRVDYTTTSHAVMSSTFCFSVAETLRCAGLTRQESLYLLIPALVEGVIGLPLIYLKWGKGKMYWFLIAEGLSYTILAIMDYFVHTRVTDPSAMTAFKTLDIVTGATSFIPLLGYTLFLYLFANATLLPLLSPRWNRIFSRTILISIPIIIAVNELSAFLGVRYSSIQLPNGGATLGVGFANDATLGPWNIIANTSLALVTAYQAIHFCLAFLHCFQKAFRGERVFSTTSERDIRLQSMRGTGWLAVGLKIGAVETAIGFAGFNFTPTIARRVLRVIGRAFILISVALTRDAPDTEGFMTFTNAPDGRKPSITQRTPGKRDLRLLISQPQTDTFRRLDRGAADQLFASLDIATAPTRPTRRMSQRVTVHFDAAKTPRLEMRFSDFAVPTLSAMSEESLYAQDDAPRVEPSIEPPLPLRRRGTTGSVQPMQSTSGQWTSVLSRSFTTVRPEAMHFPRIPVRAQTLPPAIDTTSVDLVRKLSKRKPAPLPSPATLQQAFPPHVQRISVRHDSLVLISRLRLESQLPSPYLPDDGTRDYEPSTPTSGRSSLISMPTRSSVDTDSEVHTTPMQTPGSDLLSPGGDKTSKQGWAVMSPYANEEVLAPLPAARLFSARTHSDPDVPHSVRYGSGEVQELGSPWLDGGGEQPVHGHDGLVRSVGAVRAERPTPMPLRPPTHSSVQLEKLMSPFSDDSMVSAFPVDSHIDNADASGNGWRARF